MNLAARTFSLAPFLAATLLACGSRRPAPPPANVVVVLVDALRPDHLHCYGYPRPTSPNLDALAADGTRFVNAVTSSPWTLPALATLMTSLYPSLHGAIRPSNAMLWGVDREHFKPVDALEATRTTLAEVLRAAGFRTAAFVAGAYPSAAFGFDQGFDHFVDNAHRNVRLNLDAFFDWLDGEHPPRFFMYLHVAEVHAPYAPPADEPNGSPATAAVLAEERARYARLDFDPDYAGPVDGAIETLQAIRLWKIRPSPRDVEHLAALYDRGIAYADHWIGQLVDGLARRELLERTLVVVTADHGEELLDHASVQHGTTFYDDVMRVPLLVRIPGMGRGRVVPDQVAHLDLMPTILDLLAVPTDLFLQGRSLRPLLEGGSLPERAVVGEAAQTPGVRALRTNRWKYIQETGREQLYDLAADPHEHLDLCAPDRTRCGPFAAELKAWDGEMAAAAVRLAFPVPPHAVIDPETGRRLRALGYAE